MVLDDKYKKLLNDIFSAFFKSPDSINTARFRADNEQSRTELDQLESNGYVQTRDKFYSIHLKALPYLAKMNSDAQTIVKNCGLIFALLRKHYKKNLDEKITVSEIAKNTGLSVDDVIMALRFITQAPILGGFTSTPIRENRAVIVSEHILDYNNFEDILKEQEEWERLSYNRDRETKKLAQTSSQHPAGQEVPLSATSSKAIWQAIESEFGITKMGFGKRINFIKDPFTREVIFRDVAQAFALASAGFSKPSVILAGGVIEELLRQYLKHKKISPIKKTFEGYIKTCEQEGLLKAGIYRLSDSVRYFRNLVHLAREETKRHSITKSAAKSAVASIFTIANDF